MQKIEKKYLKLFFNCPLWLMHRIKAFFKLLFCVFMSHVKQINMDKKFIISLSHLRWGIFPGNVHVILHRYHGIKVISNHPFFTSLPAGSVSKESASNEGNASSIPGSERSPGEGNGNSLQYSPMDRGP